MDKKSSEIIALKALEWVIGNDELRPVFMGASGADEEALRAAAGDPAMLLSVLEFLMMDDAWIIAFCDWAGLEYTDPMAARACLPGGEAVHWT